MAGRGPPPIPKRGAGMRGPPGAGAPGAAPPVPARRGPPVARRGSQGSLVGASAGVTPPPGGGLAALAALGIQQPPGAAPAPGPGPAPTAPAPRGPRPVMPKTPSAGAVGPGAAAAGGPGTGAGAGAGAAGGSGNTGLGVGGSALVPTYSSTPDVDFARVSQFHAELQQRMHSGYYAQEFEEIEAATANVNLTADFTSALLEVNIRKSRYKNILPLEHTRVVLHEIPGYEGTDFVCANYVSGEIEGSEHAYIGTQGPLQATVGDFWRMVWETNSRVIVMLAREVEDGKEKVYPYWPDEVPFEVEYMRITLRAVERGEQLVTRKFELEEIATGTKRTVTQFQYIAWPDQGVPATTDGFCQLVDLVDDCNREAIGKTQGGDNAGALPIIIHCSAGIGRTGTFAVFHATLAKLKLLLTRSYDAQFDVKATLLAIREQRAGMVQTAEQYQFCYQVIVDKLSEVMQLLQYKNELWFHKGLDSKKAQMMLKRKPHGTFLFRDSSAGGCIVLSAVNGKNVLHARISVDHRGFQIENDFYPTLAMLVNSRSKVFMRPILREED